MSHWSRLLRGRFLVLDGPDGSGKSTQFRRLGDHLRGCGLEVTETREPGGTAIGEQVRAILLDPANAAMDVRCEMLLYMASRAQLVSERIEPALRRGSVVLADRFISSTLAYQGTAGGLSRDEILAVGSVAVRQVRPDLTIIFDVDEPTAARRLNPILDRMELKGAAFHRRVREGFLDQARRDPAQHLVIDARPETDEVWQTLLAALHDWTTTRLAASGSHVPTPTPES